MGLKGNVVVKPVLFFWIFFSFFCYASVPPARAADRQVVEGHVVKAVTELHLPPAGRLTSSTNLNLAIELPLRNQDALASLLQEQYTPTSPQYHHWLTPEEFTTKFGPTEQDYEGVIEFAKANGFTVTRTHPNRALVDVRGSVANIERTFRVTLHTYQHPTEAREFYAPDVEPSLDLAVPILRIIGLNNYIVPHPKQLLRKPTPGANNAAPNAGSGPSGAYTGYDFRAAYLPDGTNLTGAGQVVGLLEFDGYYANDIATYETQSGLPSVTLANVLLDGFNGIPTTGPNSGNAEVALDIEMSISMAPGLSKVIVYEAGPSGIANDILSQMASDNQAKQLSCSWSFGVLGPDPTADQFFQQMAAQGQSFLNAAGDTGAFSGSTSVDFPSDDPYITQVGGTTLTTTGPGGNWASETVWNDGCFHRNCNTCLAGSGGISTSYAIPSYQQGISMSANQGSTTMRNVRMSPWLVTTLPSSPTMASRKRASAPVLQRRCGRVLSPWSISRPRLTVNPPWVFSTRPSTRSAVERTTRLLFTISLPVITPLPAAPISSSRSPATTSAPVGAHPVAAA